MELQRSVTALFYLLLLRDIAREHLYWAAGADLGMTGQIAAG